MIVSIQHPGSKILHDGAPYRWLALKALFDLSSGSSSRMWQSFTDTPRSWDSPTTNALVDPVREARLRLPWTEPLASSLPHAGSQALEPTQTQAHALGPPRLVISSRGAASNSPSRRAWLNSHERCCPSRDIFTTALAGVRFAVEQPPKILLPAEGRPP